MIWWIIQKNNWERPVYFSVTVPESNMAGLKPFLSMEGMGYRLVKQRARGQFDVTLTADHLMNTYRFSGVADPNVYKDDVARRLLGNYLVLFDGLIRAYLQQDQPGPAFQTLQKAEKLVPPYSLDTPMAWASMANHYRQTALKFAEAGRPDSALISLKELVRLDPGTSDREQIEETIRVWQGQIDTMQLD
jgi:tetratricopeptide (TPR) repeat protein